MSNVKFAPWPSFDEEIVEAVKEVLVSGKVNQWTGPNVYAFEKEYAAYLGVKHAIAMANGSVTLDVALKVLGIGPGDEVVVTSRSFVASASCVALTGALPVFADVDVDSGNMTAQAIAAVMTKKTKAVIVVHLGGWPCDMDPIMKLCRSRKVAVIEDCAQAHGAKYKGRHVGTMGAFASFSFCQDKIFTTLGEGGLLVTNNTGLWKKAWSLKDHGRDFDVVFNHKLVGTGFKWMVNSFGTNYRMTEMQAVAGRIMLKRLDKMVQVRRQHADMLNKRFAGVEGLRLTLPDENIYHAYYKYYVHVRPEFLKKGVNRDSILKELSGKGIPCGLGACPEIYKEKAFRKQRAALGLKPQKTLPVTKRLGETSMMFLVHPTLSPDALVYVADSLIDVLQRSVKQI